MMKKMGFEIDKGLGKNKQGRLEPIRAVEMKSMRSNFQHKVEKIGTT